MADPVSWLMIEPGWHVESSDGAELEVTGDSGADIFDGLAIASSMFKQPRYVPAEEVGEIVDGLIRLKLDRGAAEQLAEFKQPPVEEEIEPEKASIVQRVESAVISPANRPESIPLLRRILLWFGITGRR